MWCLRCMPRCGGVSSQLTDESNNSGYITNIFCFHLSTDCDPENPATVASAV